MIQTNIYAAGLFDGEGTITLMKVHASDLYKTPQVMMSSTTKELLVFLQTNYGGCICTQKKYKDHHKQAWSWRLSQNKALTFLESIQPYVKEPSKLNRINYLLKGYKKVTKRNGKYTESEKEKKLAFEANFFSLNGGGEGS